MILVSLGTQDFSFNRLLAELDRLIEAGVIGEEVIVQSGFSDYEPKHFSKQAFMSFQEFDGLLERCSLLITHGGTGTIVGGLKKGRKVIAIPRLREYGEHVDDHQKEIIGLFSEKGLIIGLEDVSELEQALGNMEEFEPGSFVSGNEKIVHIIENYIQQKVAAEKEVDRNA